MNFSKNLKSEHSKIDFGNAKCSWSQLIILTYPRSPVPILEKDDSIAPFSGKESWNLAARYAKFPIIFAHQNHSRFLQSNLQKPVLFDLTK